MRLTKTLAALTLLALVPAAGFGQFTAPGRFGKALSPQQVYGAAERNTVYFVVPMTIECWAKIGAGGADRAKGAPTILLSNEPRHSLTHWELLAKPGSGAFAASFPGYEPPDVTSTRDIVDGRWHHLAVVFDGTSVVLRVDGQEVAKQAVKKVKPYPDSGPLTFGHIPGVASNGDVLIDEVRLSRGVRPAAGAPEKPFAPDADTVGLWHFDEEDQAAKTSSFPDASATRNPVRLDPISQDAPAGGGFD